MNCKKRLGDISNTKFGNLLVISKSKCYRNKNICWLCECQLCKRRKDYSNYSLKRGTQCRCQPHNRLEYGISSFNHLYLKYKQSAKRRNIEFDITKDIFKYFTQQNCYYCNVSPSQIISSKSFYGEYIYNGIDRINSDLGYTEDNIVSCCGRCNEMKMSSSQIEFIFHMRKIINNLDNT